MHVSVALWYPSLRSGIADLVKKDSCNLMWTAERRQSAELKLQILELKQEDSDRIKTSKQRRTLIRIIKNIEN